MADFLKITTPLQQREQVNNTRAAAGMNAVTPVAQNENPNRIIGVTPDEAMHQQNSKLIDPDSGKPTILMNLIKDPAVTVTFLKNIYLLQEIIKLLPMNTRTKTAEIEQLFASLLIKPEDISKELKKQETASTSFRGSLFDFLRGVLQDNGSTKMKYAVANLLKALNNDMSKTDILDAVSNNLKYLADNLQSSKSLGGRLAELSYQFAQNDAAEKFPHLKQELLSLLTDIEKSILFNNDTAKLVSIINYNLSRFNTNPDFLMECVRTLMTLLDGTEMKSLFLSEIHGFINDMKMGGFNIANSQVMKILSDIIGRCASDDDILQVNPESVDKIIHSLLSSPCNYTPLLHFIIPVEYMDIKSFAEIWINTNSENTNKNGKKSNQDTIHMLIIFDIEGIGQFETELIIRDKKIDLTLFCPQNYTSQFSAIAPELRKCISFSEYTFENISFEEMKATRSLIEVFKDLPYKRTGVDVRT